MLKLYINILRLIFIYLILHYTNAYASNVPLPSKEEILNISSKDKVLGCEQANNLIIEYSSLSCPKCAEMHSTTFIKLKKEYIDTCKAKYVFRDFPTSASALNASLLANCSKNYFDYLNILFSSQKSWAFSQNFREVLLNIAKLNGMDMGNFNNCLENKELASFIALRAYNASKVLEVNYTPTLIINGNKVEGHLPYEEIIKYLK